MLQLVVIMLRLFAPFVALLVAMLEPLLFISFMLLLTVVILTSPLYFYYAALFLNRTLRF